MSFPWSDKLDFFKSGECQVCLEKLDGLKKDGVLYNPSRNNLFRALSRVSFDAVRVVVVGQDPYPSHVLATGVAFEVPSDVKVFPPTLHEIFKEYHNDLGYPIPKSGSLEKWTQQGVLLWNAIPTCIAGKSLSCYDWTEWQYLTREIITKLSDRALVFAFLGGVAREYVSSVNQHVSKVIETSHPSPRGSLNSRTPFVGSRLFSTINAKCVEQGLGTIDWRLE